MCFSKRKWICMVFCFFTASWTFDLPSEDVSRFGVDREMVKKAFREKQKLRMARGNGPMGVKLSFQDQNGEPVKNVLVSYQKSQLDILLNNNEREIQKVDHSINLTGENIHHISLRIMKEGYHTERVTYKYRLPEGDISYSDNFYEETITLREVGPTGDCTYMRISLKGEPGEFSEVVDLRYPEPVRFKTTEGYKNAYPDHPKDRLKRFKTRINVSKREPLDSPDGIHIRVLPE